jgi:FeS assembly SUF system protein
MEQEKSDAFDFDSPSPDPDDTADSTSADDDLESRIIAVLQTVYDPEIPVDIYELGLLYGIDVGTDGKVTISMTLTSPACPVAGSMPAEIEEKVAAMEGVETAIVNLVWDPPWTPDMMSEAARLELGFF